MYANLSLRAKLYLQFGVILIPVFIVLGYFLQDNHNRFTGVMEKVGRYNAAVDAERQYKRFIDAVTDAVDTGKIGQPGLAALKAAQDSLARSGAQSIETKQLLSQLSSMHQSLSDDSSLENLAKHRDLIQQAKAQISQTAERQNTAIASEMSGDLQRAQEGIFFSRALSVLIAVLAFLFARTLIKSIHQPLQSAVAIADRIAKGNLNNPPAPENNTEVGRLLQALHSMNSRPRELISEILGTSQRVSNASQDILHNNATLSQRAEAEASTLEETSASLEELTATVGKNADRTQAAQSLARAAVSDVETSSQVVRNVVTTMDDIQTSSRRIVDIIAVIDGIAFQTNILALNAAVEAARAGEQGAGFAVVASEVRNLAQRCATAAKDIKGLISNSAEKIGVGSDLADRAGKAMDNTVTSIHKVSELLGEIAVASTEQREGIAQINQAMLLLDQATQQSGEAVEQAARIASMLSDHALNLNGLVRQFDLGAPTEALPEISLHEATSKRLAVKSPTSADRSVPNKQTDNADANWREF